VIRTQIQLTEDQVRRLRRIARVEGISLAEAVRRCVEKTLHAEGGDRGARYTAAAKLVGTFRDREGATDLAAQHDRHLDEAFE
jgi:hypothetical protein